MFKRVFLFLVTNVLIMVTITTVLNLFGIKPYLTKAGLDYVGLAVFCLIWGFGGAFISLALSKIMAKWMMGVKLVDPLTTNSNEQWLLQTTYRLSQAAALPKKPDVGIYESNDINAFATGPSKSNSLVAVSTGLLHKMTRDEAEAVLAHEVAHISNGDMVTMTLLQGIVNAFGMFLARAIGFVLSQFAGEEKQPLVQLVSTIVLDILFSILGLFVVSAYSRRREYRADADSAKLAGRNKMIAALEKLKTEYGQILNRNSEPERNKGLAALQISNRRNKFLSLLSTHPDLDDRIAKLKGLS
jgi:heat shock protein HtpX